MLRVEDSVSLMSGSQGGILQNSTQKIKKMGMLKVDNFLCCCTLRTGTLIIGNMMLIGNMILFLALLYSYDEAITLPKQRALRSGYNPGYLQGVEGVFAGLFTMAIIGIVLSGSLITGVLYKMHRLLLPYLLCMAIVVVIMLLSAIITPITFAILTSMPATGAGIFFSHLISAALALHCWLVVYTCYKELEVAGEVQHIKLEEDCEA